MLAAFLRGLLLSLIAGLPLGPASAAVADAGFRGSLRAAVLVGVGGALVDAAYCLGALSGLGVIFDRQPGFLNVFMVLGGLFLVGYGFVTARRAVAATACSPHPRRPRGSDARALGRGVVVSVANPALAVSWVLLAGTVLAGVKGPDVWAASAGVFTGILAWFVAVAFLAWRGRVHLGDRVAWVGRAIGVALIAYGLVLVGRVGVVWAIDRIAN
jgi:L-lysine exporter family protein LysE/ArgO